MNSIIVDIETEVKKNIFQKPYNYCYQIF